MKNNFVYLAWKRTDASKAIKFRDDITDSVEITTSVGPYKNIYADFVLEKN
jgi:hypothetical protein